MPPMTFALMLAAVLAAAGATVALWAWTGLGAVWLALPALGAAHLIRRRT